MDQTETYREALDLAINLPEVLGDLPEITVQHKEVEDHLDKRPQEEIRLTITPLQI